VNSLLEEGRIAMKFPVMFRQGSLRGLGLIVGLLATVPASMAQAPAPAQASVFSGTAQIDEEGAYGLGAGLDLPLAEDTWLQMTAGLADSSAERDSLSTYRFGLGIDHFFAPAGIALALDYWGDGDSIDTLALKGDLYFRTERARFGVNATYRDIKLNYEVPALARNLVDDSQSFASTGVGANFRYSWGAASFYARGSIFDYDEQIGDVATRVDLSRVPAPLRPNIQQRLENVVRAVQFLSASSLTLANSLLAHSASAGIDYRVGEQTFNVEFGHDRAEVDDLDVTSLSVGWLFPAGNAVDLEVRVGTSDAGTYGTAAYGGLSVFVYR